MPRGSPIDGTGAVRVCWATCGVTFSRPQILHERLRVIVLVAAQRDHAVGRGACGPGPRRLPLRRSGRRGEARIHDQAVPVLHQHMPQETQLGLLARRLLVQPRLRIGRRGVRGIGPPLATEVHAGIARIIRRRHGRGVALRLKLFWPAQASINVPSTVKCSSDKSRWALACASTCSKNAVATSPANSRSRFFVKTVTSHTGASSSRPTNQRNSRLYCSCSIKSRSLRSL